MEKEGDVSNSIREGNISLILDSYEDIFSDFDPRPYSERGLSDDFIGECRRAIREHTGGVELRLMVPRKKRKLEDEKLIKRRIEDHIRKHFKQKQDEIKKLKQTGIKWIILGTILMFGTALVKTYKSSFLINLLFVIAEPAGWFSFWEGLGKIFIDSEDKNPEYEFYKKMSKTKIIFLSY